MFINHNINATIAYNRANLAGKTKSNAMEKLSSGMRINKAADDSADSTISQQMRAQIRGLEQAGRNIQDGTSLIQTAESGLSEIENPNLQRIRELCVKASNGTLTDEDRKIIQKEIDEIRNGINDIANNTEFNTIKLLRPPISETPITAPGKADIVFIIDKTGSMSGTITNVQNNIESFVGQLQSNNVDVRLGLVTYGDCNLSEGGDSIIKKDFTNDVETFKTFIGEIVVSGGGDMNESGLEGIEEGALMYSFRDTTSKQFILVTDAKVHNFSEDGESLYDIDSVADDLKNNNIKLTVVGSIDEDIKNQLKKLSDSTGGSYLNLSGDFASQLSSLASNIAEDSAEIMQEDEMPVLNLQVGANSGQEFKVELFDARTKNLGIDSIKVDSIKEAEKSLKKVDKAIELVSNQRSKFGAYENALEHIKNNVENYNYNITSAESRISDADMAKEIMKMTKGSIIEQSAQSILKQAQKMPESVIDLVNKWQENV
ncbi:flagellin [Clostridium kluyveri]|uniref:Flagellin n=1 Tax=Clostridium kluyveri TaxID=1534 RepID=A0A1L5F8J1_CLOKL|nr:flagellin [Clostridium kluyveri]APM39292.1 flagellin [Clostridium kluyveri]